MAEMKTTQMERESVFEATAEVQTGSHQSHGAPSEKRKVEDILHCSTSP
ncbi:hypothetical protein NFI96_023547, partial [Prochilodus magdalenae]